MQLMGIDTGQMRLPLIEMSPENTERLKAILVDMGLVKEK